MRTLAILLPLLVSNVLKPHVVAQSLSTPLPNHATNSERNSQPATQILANLLPLHSNTTISSSFLTNTKTPANEVFIAFTDLTKIVCVVILAFGILGNALVLIIFGCRCSSLRPLEIYMVNLAVADLIGTVIFPSIQLHTVLGGSFHAIGKGGCKLIYFLTTLCITESALTLIVISVDRYIIVMRPFRARISNLMIAIVITMTWSLSSLLGLSHLIGDRMILSMVDKKGTYVCRVIYRTPDDYEDATIYNLVIFAVQNAIPLVVMTILYCIIIFKLHRTHSETYNPQYIRNSKTIKLLIAIVVSFLVCVTPSNIFYMIYHFNALGMSTQQAYPIYAFLTMLLMANSCINPVIYTTLHASFRRRMRNVFCICCNDGRRSYNWRGFREIKSAVTASLRHPSNEVSDCNISLREITDQEHGELRNRSTEIKEIIVGPINHPSIDENR